ncbi:MAG: hypothetical protein CSA62_01790 [Planctomycetota bacterium]|nr:MAG: hypothetical protein CSA62_01790 [Planctomycetota bacterium]
MLTVVIPALNEEQSIESICRRVQAVAPEIRQHCGHDLEIIVVDDGSTDRTAKLASAIDGIEVLSFSHNKGYGAALMAGFEKGRGELVSFLDADGTCDPKFFVPLIKAIEEGGASVALGNRLGESSEMPKLRRIGNLFFAALIRRLSGASVQDSASGMRVIRRDALQMLAPLPTGLHFTPAMSCRAALDPRLTLAEVPMTYAEREGESKLGVVRDGLRFLRIILQIAVQYRPLLLFGLVGALQLLAAFLYALSPLSLWFRNHSLPDDSVYRVLSILVFAVGGFGFLYAGAVLDEAQRIVHPLRQGSLFSRFIRLLLFAHPFWIALGLFLVAVMTNIQALWQYVSTGSIQAHWSTIAFGALLSVTALQLAAFGLVQHVLRLLAERARASGLDIEATSSSQSPAASEQAH